MSPTPIRNNHGAVPMWVKVVLGVVVVGFLVVVGLCFMAFNAVKDMMATEPAKVAAMSKDIAVISDPLPGGFTWQMGMNMKVMQLVSAQSPDKQVIMLMTIPTAEKDAQAMLDESTTHPKTYGSSTARMVSVDQKGTQNVGGLPMAWELGTLEKDGKQSKGYIGVVVDKPKSKTIMIIGVQPTGEYNLVETKRFLGGIQSF